VGNQRESWTNPLGKVFSLAALGMALLFGVFAVISVTEVGGSVGVFPRIPKGDEVARHIEMLKRRKS